VIETTEIPRSAAHGQVEFLGEVASEGLGQGALAGSHVTGEQEQRSPVAEQGQRGDVPGVVLVSPLAKPVGVGEQDGFLAEPALDFVQSDETLVPICADRFGEFDDWVEQVILRAQRSLLARSLRSVGLKGATSAARL